MKREPKDIIRRFQKLKGERQVFDTHWQELADYVLPNRNDITAEFHPGEKRNLQIFNSTAIQSSELLAGALHGMLTNPAVKWFELLTGDIKLDETADVRLWLNDTEDRMHNLLNNSNFQQAIHELYLNLVTFGTGLMVISEHKKKYVVFESRHVKEIYIDENHIGEVNEVYREFKWDAKNIVSMFGPKDLPRSIEEAYKSNNRKKFCIVHAVYPDKNNEQEQSTFGLNHQFHSQYVMTEGSDKDHELSHGGFRQMPYVIPRWSKGSGEVYGRSPAMNALPDIKMINKMEETVLKGAQKTVDPPLQLPDDGFIMPIVTRPGGLNFYRAGSQDTIKPVFNDARIDFGVAALDRVANRIREAFFIDQLQLNQGPQMTATEVMQRTEEKMRLLGPMLGRQQNELLRPMIDRIFDIMLRRGLLTPPPRELQGLNLDVRYSSLIAKSQRVNDANNIIRTVQLMQPFVQADPSVLDYVDADEALKVIAKMNGLPQRIIRDDEEVKKIREARQQATQEAAQQAQQTQELDNVQQLSNIGAQSANV